MRHSGGDRVRVDPATTPRELRPLMGGKLRDALILSNWPDLFRYVTTMSADPYPAQPSLFYKADSTTPNSLTWCVR